MRYVLDIYTIEQTRLFDDKESACDEQEYLERVKNKICIIRKVDE